MHTFPLGISVSERTEELLLTYKQHGIIHIELLIDPHSTVSWAEETVATIKELDLSLWSIHLPFGEGWDLAALEREYRETTIQKMKQWLEFAVEWGAKVAVVHPCLEPILSEERQQKLDNARESLSELGKFAAEKGIKLAVECLPRSCLGNTSEEIIYLTNTPELYVCCDANHLFYEKPQDFIRTLGEKVITTHMSDWDGKDERHWLPGQGINEWREICSALNGIGYQGPFLFEVQKSAGDKLRRSWEDLWK